VDERREASVKSMEFCQLAISRMAGNSFKLKAWFLVAYTAFFTFFAKSASGETNYSASLADLIWLIPMLVFPILDAYYLQQERMFIGVFSDFADLYNGKENPRMSFDLRPTKDQRNNFTLLNVVFSISVGWLYLPLLAAFQALIIFHSKTECSIFYMSIFPVVMLIMAFFFKKKTKHQSK